MTGDHAIPSDESREAYARERLNVQELSCEPIVEHAPAIISFRRGDACIIYRERQHPPFLMHETVWKNKQSKSPNIFFFIIKQDILLIFVFLWYSFILFIVKNIIVINYTKSFFKRLNEIWYDFFSAITFFARQAFLKSTVEICMWSSQFIRNHFCA